MKQIKKMKKHRFPFFTNAYYFVRITAKWLITGRKDLKYYAMARLGNMFNSKFHFTEYGQVWRDDTAFEKYYDDLVGDEYHSINRKVFARKYRPANCRKIKIFFAKNWNGCASNPRHVLPNQNRGRMLLLILKKE